MKNTALVLMLVMSMGFEAERALAASPASNQTTPPPKGWSGKMQGLYHALSDLLTDVTSDRRYNDPKNFQRIQKSAEKIATLSHGLGKKAAPAPDADPSLEIIGDLLKEEAGIAVKALKQGNRVYAREILNTLPSYCIACHIRNDSGPQFQALPLEPAVGSLSPLERGEFYAATRQYDRAEKEFTNLISDKKALAKDPWGWRKAVQQSLAIAVRVKKSPQKSEEIVDAVIASADAPLFLKGDAKAWKKTIQDWKAEKPARAETEKGLRAEAMRLFAKARELQEYPMDRTADIVYLRASAAAHDLLQVTKESTAVADALLLAGLSYEVLEPLRTENLHEIYYQTCIRRSPHTATAEVCFKRLENSVILGYTGSAGTDVPEDIMDRLAKLRGMAKVGGDSPDAPKNPASRPN